jgi:hypothetical protein
MDLWTEEYAVVFGSGSPCFAPKIVQDVIHFTGLAFLHEPGKFITISCGKLIQIEPQFFG